MWSGCRVSDQRTSALHVASHHAISFEGPGYQGHVVWWKVHVSQEVGAYTCELATWAKREELVIDASYPLEAIPSHVSLTTSSGKSIPSSDTIPAGPIIPQAPSPRRWQGAVQAVAPPSCYQRSARLALPASAGCRMSWHVYVVRWRLRWPKLTASCAGWRRCLGRQVGQGVNYAHGCMLVM